jgi:hypothetical protein
MDSAHELHPAQDSGAGQCSELLRDRLHIRAGNRVASGVSALNSTKG